MTSAVPPNTTTVPGAYSASAVYFSAKSAYSADVAVANIVLNLLSVCPMLPTPLEPVLVMALVLSVVIVAVDIVPTLVMLGCAAVVTVPAVVADPTANEAAVPVSPVPAPVNELPVTVPVALTKPAVRMLPPCTLPVTLTLDNVPTDVMLGCAAVVTVPAVVAEVAAPVKAPTNVVLVTLVKPATVVTVAPSVSAVLPSVTAALAKRACAKVPALMLVALIAVTLAPDPFSVPMKLPDEVLPVTARALSVPTDVILGCAFVVTVPAVVAAPVKAPTNVVLVTLVSPATVVTVAPSVSAVLPRVTAALASLACASVPELILVAEIAVTLAPDPFSVPMKLPDVVLPVTARALSVPTDVMLGCAAVVTVPATVAVPTVRLDAVPVSPVPAPINWPAVVILPLELIAPEFNEVSVPTEVIFGCAAVVTVPAVVAELAAPVRAPTNVVLVTLVKPATVVTVAPNVSAVEPRVTAALASLACAKVPALMLVAEIAVTLAPDPFSVPMKLPDVVLPVTARALNVPTDVMLGCAAVVTVPATVAVPTVKLAAVPVKLVPAPENTLPVMVPVAEIKPAVRILPPCTLPVTLAVLKKALPKKLLAPPRFATPFEVGVMLILLCQLVVAL